MDGWMDEDKKKILIETDEMIDLPDSTIND